jgi:hypothetical protein
MADHACLDLSSNATSFDSSTGWKHGSHEMDFPSSPIGEQNSLWQTLSSSSDDSTSVLDTHGARHYSPQNKDAQSAAFQLPTDEPAVLYSGYAPFAVTDVNDLWLRACGFSRDEVIGQTMRIIQGPGTEWDLIDSLMSNVRRRQPFSTALTNYTKTRQPFRHELRVVPLGDGDGLRGPHFLARCRIVSLDEPFGRPVTAGAFTLAAQSQSFSSAARAKSEQVPTARQKAVYSRKPIVPMPSTAASPFFRPVSDEQSMINNMVRLAALKRCGSH